MSSCRELIRRKILEDLYDGMSDEEKKHFVRLMIDNRSNQDILEILHKQSKDIEDIGQAVSQRTWLTDFTSNIAGNAVWDGLLWIGSRLLRK